jgi:hypothetical protein
MSPTSENSPAASNRLLLLGITVTSMAGLIIELALTRLFSVLFYYHFAFMAISVALLGLGAGGLFSYWIAGDRPLDALWSRLAALSGINAVVTVAALSIILRMQLSVTTINAQTLIPLSIVYFSALAPFFFAGVILSVVIARSVDQAGAVYFADLGGAGLGGLLLIPLLNFLGGPNTILFAAWLWAAGAVLWSYLGRGKWERWALLPLALAIAIAGNARLHFLDVKSAKGYLLNQETFNKWNSFSRVGLSRIPEGLDIRIDADAATMVAETPLTDKTFWIPEVNRYGMGLAHRIEQQFHPGATTLVIGPGGGYDVARALTAGSRMVTGVEINPIIINDIMLGVARDANHGLYARPDVHIVVEDGRSYARRSPDRYGVIQATLVDTWASTAAGAFALTENNLYTVDAFREYIRHLDDGGMLSITRWEFEQPREALRLISLGVEALREEGATDPAQHFVVVCDGALSHEGARATMLLKRAAFTRQELDAIQADVQGSDMSVLYLPGKGIANAFGELLQAPDSAGYENSYPYDITPVWDNRPFFFFNVRTRDVLSMWAGKESMDLKVNLGLLMLMGLMVISAVAVALFLVLPARLSTRLPRVPGVNRWLLYFAAIGLAYILVEVAFIQKFVLFLGHPTYALTVAVFILLMSSGIGSYWTRTFDEEQIASRLPRLLIGAAAWIGLLAACVTPLLTALVSLPLAGRVFVAGVLLAPAGFLMGTAFPSGLRLAGRVSKDCLQWAWAMNAATSVLGSLVAVFVSIHFGIWQTMTLGGVCYLAACLLASRRYDPSVQ